MKKIFIQIFAYISPVLTLAQIVSPDGGPVATFGGGTLTVSEVDPGPEIIDTWEPPVMEGDRSVIWIHGLGGHGDLSASDESNSWIQASSTSDINYQMESRRPDYSDVSLDAASTTLRTQLQDYDLSTDAFLIAHSQGGIVSRQFDKYIHDLGWERTFNGVVTFGTPHGGAMILNNRDLIVQWLDEACDDLGNGPWQETLDDSFFFSILNLFSGIENADDKVCALLIDEILPVMFNLDAYYAGVTDGYYVGSPELDELNAYTPDIPYVTFWGEETEPVSWNTMVHMLPGKSVNSEIYGAFGANNDPYLTEQATYMQNYYLAKYNEYKNNKVNWDEFWDLIIDFFEDDAAITDAEVAAAYRDGYDWFTQANSTWKVIIGATELVYGTNTSCLCVDVMEGYEVWYTEEDLMDFSCDEIEFYYEPFSECNEVVDVVLVDVIEKINDGVVLKESASSCPGKVSGKKMDGSNHFSMRNDLQTQIRLDELFGGFHGSYFEIAPR